MTKESNMITKNDAGQITGISINGINFSTKEAFVQYRDNHQFKAGDAVNALVKQYSQTNVYPAVICGINDFGDSRVSIDIAYMDSYNELKFDSILSDEARGSSEKKENGVVGLAPINEFNDIGIRATSVIEALDNQILAEENKLKTIRSHRDMLAKFLESMKG